MHAGHLCVAAPHHCRPLLNVYRRYEFTITNNGYATLYNTTISDSSLVSGEKTESTLLVSMLWILAIRSSETIGKGTMDDE